MLYAGREIGQVVMQLTILDQCCEGRSCCTLGRNLDSDNLDAFYFSNRR